MRYNKEFVKKATEFRDKGHSFKELEEAFGISSTTYYAWKKKLAEGYYDKPKIKQTRKRLIDKEKLALFVKENPDRYLREYAEEFNCSFQAIDKALKVMNITYKKKHLHTQKNQKKNEQNINK